MTKDSMQNTRQKSRSQDDASRATSVLFVCLGNICRSPLAEGVLRHLLSQKGTEWRVDSAGTGAYHVGEPADPRSCAVAEARGITLDGVARKLRASDFLEFDYIIAMDRENLANIEALRAAHGGAAAGDASIHLLREFDPEGEGDEVPDPYFGGERGFDEVFEMVHRSCVGFLNEVSG